MFDRARQARFQVEDLREVAVVMGSRCCHPSMSKQQRKLATVEKQLPPGLYSSVAAKVECLALRHVHWMVNRLRDKISRFCQPQTAKKNSRLTAKISRILRFAQMKNLEIYVSRET